jgi:hypothetical protein
MLICIIASLPTVIKQLREGVSIFQQYFMT